MKGKISIWQLTILFGCVTVLSFFVTKDFAFHLTFIIIFLITLASAMLEKLIDKRKRHKHTLKALQDNISQMDPYEFEEYVAELLRSKGYKNVNTTPKSGDYGADIIATSPKGDRVCVQCKKYSQPVGVKAVQEIIAARSYYHCTKAFVYATNTFTPQAVKMAEETDVHLYTLE